MRYFLIVFVVIFFSHTAYGEKKSSVAIFNAMLAKGGPNGGKWVKVQKKGYEEFLTIYSCEVPNEGGVIVIQLMKTSFTKGNDQLKMMNSMSKSSVDNRKTILGRQNFYSISIDEGDMIWSYMGDKKFGDKRYEAYVSVRFGKQIVSCGCYATDEVKLKALEQYINNSIITSKPIVKK